MDGNVGISFTFQAKWELLYKNALFWEMTRIKTKQKKQNFKLFLGLKHK